MLSQESDELVCLKWIIQIETQNHKRQLQDLHPRKAKYTSTADKHPLTYRCWELSNKTIVVLKQNIYT